MYVGVYNSYGLYEAGLVKYTYALGGDGVVLEGGPRYGTADNPEDGYGEVLAHEFGHAKGLGHPACPDSRTPGYLEERYPYEDGRLGPARGWHLLDRSFVERDKPVSFGYGLRGEVYDIMTYCHSKFVSDFTYQHVLTVLQAPFYKKRMEDTRACMAERANASTSHRTLAIMGEIGADGTVTVLSMRESDQPAWPEPTAGSLPPGARLWTMELLDGTGGAVSRHGIPVPDHADAPPADSRHDDAPRLWSRRMPYPASVQAVVVRDHSGDVRATARLNEHLNAL